MPSNVGSFPLKVYFYKQLLILKGATVCLKLWLHYLNYSSVKRRVSKRAFSELNSWRRLLRKKSYT